MKADLRARVQPNPVPGRRAIYQVTDDAASATRSRLHTIAAYRTSRLASAVHPHPLLHPEHSRGQITEEYVCGQWHAGHPAYTGQLAPAVLRRYYGDAVLLSQESSASLL
jgi:hypothetical protein